MDTEIPGSLLVALATAIGILVGEGAPASPPGCRGQAKLSLRGEVCRGGVILSSKSSLEVSSSNPVTNGTDEYILVTDHFLSVSKDLANL